MESVCREMQCADTVIVVRQEAWHLLRKNHVYECASHVIMPDWGRAQQEANCIKKRTLVRGSV